MNEQDLVDRILLNLQRKTGLLRFIPCSQEENEHYKQINQSGGQLPEWIGWNQSYQSYGQYEDVPFSPEERSEYLELKKLNDINAIKKWVTFFGILTIISLIITLASFILTAVSLK